MDTNVLIILSFALGYLLAVTLDWRMRIIKEKKEKKGEKEVETFGT